MAEQTENGIVHSQFVFVPRGHRTPVGGIVYPWKEWLNGKIWEVEQGVHFHCDVRSFLSLLHKRRLYRCETARISPTTVVFKYTLREPR